MASLMARRAALAALALVAVWLTGGAQAQKGRSRRHLHRAGRAAVGQPDP